MVFSNPAPTYVSAGKPGPIPALGDRQVIYRVIRQRDWRCVATFTDVVAAHRDCAARMRLWHEAYFVKGAQS